MKIAASCRLFLLRRPWIYWIVVATAAVTVGLVVRDRLRSIDAQRSAWGETRLVWIAERDVDVGDIATVSLREFPIAMIPAAAVTPDTDVGIVRQRLRRGEIVVDADLGAGSGPAALADDGQVVIAVDDPLISTADPGATVAVYAEGLELTRGGRVMTSADGVVLVAVDERDAPVVAAAARLGTASLGFTR